MRRTAIVLVLALLLVPLSGTVGEAATFDWSMVWAKHVDMKDNLPAAGALSGIGFGGPAGYVAVGTIDLEPAILTSTTAAQGTWQWANIVDPNGDPLDGKLFDVVYSDDHKQYVAVGNGEYVGDKPLIIVSNDGMNWTVVADHGLDNNETKLLAVAYGNGVYVAVGEDFFAWSADGLDWHSVPGTFGGLDGGGDPIYDALEVDEL